MTCTYDNPQSSAPQTYARTERGPPAANGHTTIDHAADRWSNGASSRPEGAAPWSTTIYTAPATYAQSDSATTTTGGHMVVTDSDLSWLGGASVAANTAADVCKANSFTGDTLVLMADGTKKAIKDVKVGDWVMATDPETGIRGARRVLDLIRHGGLHTMVAVRLVDGSTIDATDRHPFWVANRGEDGAWVDAIDLEPGDQVQAADGDLLEVESTGVRVEDVRAFNLTVDDLHTYHVGDEDVLVHNAGCMSSVIGNDPFLVRAAESAGKNPQVQREMDGLFAQLSAGNMNPGLGTRTLSGTGISYARSRGGARLFFRNVDGGIEIVAKASKGNEPSVINYLMGLYGP